MIKSKQLAKALYELSKENVPNLEDKFFDFIKERNLEAELPTVLYHLEKITEIDREKNGIQIEVAHDVKHDTIIAIKKFLETEHLPEVIKIKKDLVAGFRAKWNGVIYDSSISTGLKKLKAQIISA